MRLSVTRSTLDAAYFDLEAYKTMIVTAWIAFVDVTEENGCLEVIFFTLTSQLNFLTLYLKIIYD